MDGRRLIELLVHVEQAGIALLGPSHRRDAVRSDLGEALGVDRQADDLDRVDLEQRSGRRDSLHDRHVGRLVTEVAEIDRERRLRGPRDSDQHDVRLVEPAPDPVVVLDRELDRLDALEVGLVERGPCARRHPRGHPGDAGDRVDRVPEQVAVVDAGAAAELAHRLAQAGLDERVDHHGRAAPGGRDRQLQIVDRSRRADGGPRRTAARGTGPRARARGGPRSLPSNPRRYGARPGSVRLPRPGGYPGAGAGVRRSPRDRLATPRLTGRHPGCRAPPRGSRRTNAALAPAARRRRLRQAGEPAAHRLVQVPRCLQCARLDAG